MVILDTDHMSLFERGNDDALRLAARLDPLPPSDKATTIVTYEEQTRGWLAYLAKARTLDRQLDGYKKLRRHLAIYCQIQVLEFDQAAADEFQRLSGLRLGVGTMDRKMAAIVLAHDATLLSRNLRDFHKIDGLKVEDWTV
ncbi:MAG TPA: type II toxin-antitoxin system VapC family toxin [Gemmataceae bacterium]|nr:type II toxin-antitoxin system VapC family toxin [Gemmataceae bacterium]